MKIQTIKTGDTIVSPAVPNRAVSKNKLAYTGLFQKRKNRITVPVKCYYVEVAGHKFLIDAGWSKEVVSHPVKHLGLGLYFASEPAMKVEEAASQQIPVSEEELDGIFMTHLDCDHASGLHDFPAVNIYASKEEIAFSKKRKVRYGSLVKNLNIIEIPFILDEKAPFRKSCDIFGDESVIAYFTPTHSAGSVMYLIKDETGFALIVGDNGYSKDSWAKGLIPGPLYSEHNMRYCLKWINWMSKKEKCKGVFCAHSPE